MKTYISGLPALGTATFEYSLQMLVRSVVQSDFSIFVCEGGENSRNVRFHTKKILYKNTRKHIRNFVLYDFGEDTAAYHCV